MPWTRQVIEHEQLESENTRNNIGDQAVYGTLRFRRLSGNLTAWSQGNKTAPRGFGI